MVKIVAIGFFLLLSFSYTRPVCMCPQASFGPFPRFFCGKELRALHPANDCELEGGLRCIKPLEPAEQTKNCSRVPYKEDKIAPLYRVCDFNKMQLDCNNLTCCDLHVKARGCSEPFPAKGIDRYRLTLTANYDEERKAWYADCLSHLKTLGDSNN